MLRACRTLVALGALVSMSTAHATHQHPGPNAKKIIANLVMAYAPCTAPDTTTDVGGWPACSTTVRLDPACGFGPSGRGQVKMQGSSSRFRVGFKLTGLDAGCEGSNMALGFRWRVTGDLCAGTTCTLDETVYMPGYGGCTVTNGACVMNATASPEIPALAVGGRTAVELLEATVYRLPMVIPAFRTGIVGP